jgi:hypothetical protein
VKKDTTNAPADVADEMVFDNWFDPIETELRTKVRGFIEAMIEEELETVLAHRRYGRRSRQPVADDVGTPTAGHRHGRRTRSLTGTFGRTGIAARFASIEVERQPRQQCLPRGCYSLASPLIRINALIERRTGRDPCWSRRA